MPFPRLFKIDIDLSRRKIRHAAIKEFPQIRLVPCEPIEGEDIHLWAYLPLPPEERLTVQERIVEIEQTVRERYGVQTVVVAMPAPT